MKTLVAIVILLAVCLTGCKNKQEENNNTVSKTSYTNAEKNSTNKYIENNVNNTNINITEKPKIPTEIDLASFSTKIMYKDTNRQHNMALTCSKLNGTIVKAGESFSFCNTVGKATAEAGYKEAEIFDKNGNIKKGYGGGNCQVSSTLYNVVLQIPGLKVLERHEHSRKVSYVESGKDAAVAYGSIDFRFKNENNYDIKIYSESTEDSINLRIVKIENI